MAGRKIVDERDALECLDAAATSGGEFAAWARRNGIDGRSLQAWRLNLERGGRWRGRDSELRLVELVASPPQTQPGCRVRCGPFVLEVDADFDDRVVSRLLSLVAAC